MDNSFPYLIIFIVMFHFVVGIGYLLYKITRKNPRKSSKEGDFLHRE